MTADLTNRIIAQGRALVRAIEALSTIQPSGPPADGRLQARMRGLRSFDFHPKWQYTMCA